MAEVITLVGLEAARDWLELARTADDEDEAHACYRAHRKMMTRVERAPAPALEPERAQVRQTASAD
jgi:hypothetical protein